MRGWDLKFQDNLVTAIPNVEVLSKMIQEAAAAITEKIANEETKMLLMNLSEESITKLIHQCAQELNRRKALKGEQQ